MIEIAQKYFVKSGTSLTYGPTLLNSLGFFWSELFGEKNTIKGYSFAQSEELIQRYYDLIETVASHSVVDIPVLHTERWSPLRIRKSLLGKTPLVLTPETSSEAWVIGAQGAGDYNGVTFTLGKSKPTADGVYVYPLPEGLKKFGLIANRILRPSLLFPIGSSVKVTDSVMYFDQNIFLLPEITRYTVVDEVGAPKTFINTQGEQEVDEEAIVWVYHGEVDSSLLQVNFGAMFDITLKSTEGHKQVLQSLMKLTVSGPSVAAIRGLMSAFVGVRLIQETGEVVEDIINHQGTTTVITSKNSYAFDSNSYSLKPNVVVGTSLGLGDPVCDAVEYHDYVTSKDWWNRTYQKTAGVPLFPEVSLGKHLFLGNYKYGLIFENAFRAVYYDSSGSITFPVLGNSEDIIEFHRVINLNAAELAAALGLTKPAAGDAPDTVTINPLDFVFSNFLKTTSGVVKAKFKSLTDSLDFMENFGTVRSSLPINAYLLFFIDVDLPTELLSQAASDIDTTLATVNGSGWVTNMASSTNPIGRRLFSAETLDFFTMTGDQLFLANQANFADVDELEACHVFCNADSGWEDPKMLRVLDGTPIELLGWQNVTDTPVVFNATVKPTDVSTLVISSATMPPGDVFTSFLQVGYLIVFHDDPDTDMGAEGTVSRVTAISEDLTTITFSPSIELPASRASELETARKWSFEPAFFVRDLPVLRLYV